MTFDQSEYDIRCEWGEQGIRQLAPISDAIVIVDLISFSTSVTIAVARGAIIHPYRWKKDAGEYARSIGAEVAGSRQYGTPLSLSQTSLMAGVTPGTRLVMPSPNGSTLSLATGAIPTFVGCLRNAKSVAEAAMRCGSKIAVIPAGERWGEDNSLRPAIEDLLGAGALISHLKGTLSPEAELAKRAYLSLKDELLATLLACSSGKELVERGFEGDVRLCAEVDVDEVAPMLVDGGYQSL